MENTGKRMISPMKIAIVGYGKMGHAIEKLARQRGHEVSFVVDNAEQWLQAEGMDADVAVEFSTPATAVDNLRRCIERNLPVVCGTTGWYGHYDEVSTLCLARGGAMLTATNFSLGMNIMFAINERLAELMSSHPEYTVGITEVHHIHKLDAPSGTAITLREQIEATGRQACEVPIESIREGEVPGIHTVCYNGPIDSLTISHEAHSREGLAMGAVLAAEFIRGKHGVFTMKDLLR